MHSFPTLSLNKHMRVSGHTWQHYIHVSVVILAYCKLITKLYTEPNKQTDRTVICHLHFTEQEGPADTRPSPWKAFGTWHM